MHYASAYLDGAERLSRFAGRDIVCFGTDEPDDKPLDAPVGWRISIGPQACDDYEEMWDVLAEATGDRTHPTFRSVFETFLEHVPPASVEALVIGNWGHGGTYDAAPAQLLSEAAGRLTGLKALFIGETRDLDDEYDSGVAELLAAYPRLEVLRVRGGMEGGSTLRRPLTHRCLRYLALEASAMSREVIEAVLASDLPALEGLELWLGLDLIDGPTVDDLAPLLAGERRPPLRHLGLRNAEIADELAGVLATAPVVAGLETLDLSLGTLGDAGAEMLLDGQPLTHLQMLDLHHHYLSPGVQARLAGELPGIVNLAQGQDHEARHRGIGGNRRF